MTYLHHHLRLNGFLYFFKKNLNNDKFSKKWKELNALKKAKKLNNWKNEGLDTLCSAHNLNELQKQSFF